jgi:hypothetical protein
MFSRVIRIFPTLPIFGRPSLTAVVISLLLIACASPTGSLASTPTPSEDLGLALGRVSLHATIGQVQAILGRPAAVTTSHGIGSPEWRYSDGLTVFLRDPNDTYMPNTVWRLTSVPPFAGSTSRGFHLGDSEDKFNLLYKGFRPQRTQANELRLTAERSLTLSVLFDSSGKAVLILIEDDGCCKSMSAVYVSSA